MADRKLRPLFQMRRTRDIIFDGLGLFVDRFRQLLKASWPAALIFGIVWSIMVNTNGQLQLSAAAMLHQGVQSGIGVDWAAFDIVLLVQTALLLLYAAASALIVSHDVELFRRHIADEPLPAAKWVGSWNWPLVWCTAKCMLWMLLIDVIVGVVSGGVVLLMLRMFSPMAAVAGTLFLALFVMLLMLPLYYTIMDYLTGSNNSFVRALKEGYPVGLHYYGKVFAVTITSGLLFLLLILITQTPSFILMTANQQALVGQMMGDEVAMPESMFWVSWLFPVFTGFIMAYLCLAMMMPYYYLYGHIVASQKNRKPEFENQIIDEKADTIHRP